MITRNREVTNPFEEQLLALCCKQEIENNIIPTLYKIQLMDIHSFEQQAYYLHLLEQTIKSTAILQKIRLVAEISHSHAFTRPTRVGHLKVKSDIKIQQFIDMYLANQGQLTNLLLSPGNLLSRSVEISYLTNMVQAAAKGTLYLKNLPVGLPIFTESNILFFNKQLLKFLKKILEENDSYDVLYHSYRTEIRDKSAFISLAVALTFRLHLMIEFFDEQFSIGRPLPSPSSYKEILAPAFEQFLLFLINKNYALASAEKSACFT